MPQEGREALFLQRWRKDISDIVKLRYPGTPQSKIDKVLDKMIEKYLVNPECELFNNYTGKAIKTNLLTMVDLIYDNKLIFGGGASFFVKPEVKKSPLIPFIESKMAKRKYHKKRRAMFEKGSLEYLIEDLFQLNTKIVINSLYGALGYFRFILYNEFVAESITLTGQNIISTTAMGFEDFLTDNVLFVNEPDMYVYVNNIVNEYRRDLKSADLSFMQTKTPEEVYERIMRKVKFDISEVTKNNLMLMIRGLTDEELKILYYKNNFEEFNNLPMIKNKISYIFSTLGKLEDATIEAVEDDNCKLAIEDLWKFYKTFVLYNYPVYDRIRKCKYSYRKSVLYIDTDSNMVSCNGYVTWLKNNIDCSKHPDIDTVGSLLLTIFLTRFLAEILIVYCDSIGVSKDYTSKLSFKNEFYFPRMVFGDKKKRYLALMLYQEGKLLNHGEGLPEIKGFDFIKANTKDTTREVYTDICLNDILKVKDINVHKIASKIFRFRDNIVKSLNNGDTEYYKQSSVKILSAYKKPYSIQGIKGTLIWNCLFPEYEIELPVDLDIIPIKDLSSKQMREFLEKECPDVYKRLNRDFYNSSNETLRKMEMNVLAKPKNNDLKLPKWYFDLIDKDKILTDNMKLIAPIMGALGIPALKTTTTKTHVTNIIKI